MVSQCLKARFVVMSQGAVLVATADDLEEEVGGVGIVGEVANLIDGEQGGARVVAEAAFEGAGGLLAIEIEQQVRGGDEARAVAGQDDLMDDVLGEHGLAKALGVDQEDVLGAVEEVEGQGPGRQGRNTATQVRRSLHSRIIGVQRRGSDGRTALRPLLPAHASAPPGGQDG